MGKPGGLVKVCAMSIALGACAPLVLLSLLAKRKLAYRIVPVIRFMRAAGVRLSHHRESWLREITLYEILTGEIPKRSR